MVAGFCCFLSKSTCLFIIKVNTKWQLPRCGSTVCAITYKFTHFALNQLFLTIVVNCKFCNNFLLWQFLSMVLDNRVIWELIHLWRHHFCEFTHLRVQNVELVAYQSLHNYSLQAFLCSYYFVMSSQVYSWAKSNIVDIFFHEVNIPLCNYSLLVSQDISVLLYKIKT